MWLIRSKRWVDNKTRIKNKNKNKKESNLESATSLRSRPILLPNNKLTRSIQLLKKRKTVWKKNSNKRESQHLLLRNNKSRVRRKTLKGRRIRTETRSRQKQNRRNQRRIKSLASNNRWQWKSNHPLIPSSILIWVWWSAMNCCSRIRWMKWRLLTMLLTISSSMNLRSILINCMNSSKQFWSLNK